jgi:L-fucose dehydrogenase
MADFFPKVEATQYRGSVGLPEARLDEFLVNLTRITLAEAEFDGRDRHSRCRRLTAFCFPLKSVRFQARMLSGTIVPMDLHLQNRVTLVTGGAKGIGAAICRALGAEGAIPVVIGRNQSDNQGLAREIEKTGGRALAIQAELARTDDCRAAVQTALSHFGRIDGLVNNAGINDGVNLEHGDTDRFLASLRKNLVHYYDMAHLALPELKKSRGAIVNIGSKVAETGQGGTSAYAAANGGRNALTREWAVELAKYGIRVNAVIVAECWTPMYETWLGTQPDPAAARKQIEARIPLGQRMTTGEEIAASVLFLLSDRSSHTTGQLLHVDGGYVHLDRAIEP